MWTLYGAIIGTIQGVIGRFRSTNGYLEHNSSGTWNTVYIPCKKPRTANLNQVTTAQNTWYTLLNVTSGAGRLSEVVLTAIDGTVQASSLQIEITVDGQLSTITGISIYTVSDYGVSTTGGTDNKAFLLYRGDIEFTTSLLIRVRHTAVYTNPLYSTVHYALI